MDEDPGWFASWLRAGGRSLVTVGCIVGVFALVCVVIVGAVAYTHGGRFP